MPKGIYSNRSCSSDHPDFDPTNHQERTKKTFLKNENKGMLLYHGLGSGKTCTSITIADEMLKKGLVKHVYICTPGSLREIWILEYCNVCGEKRLGTQYTFITYNYHGIGEIPDLNNSLVIIDEVHNLINGVKNKTQYNLRLYNAIANSNCRVLALSGTPIAVYPAEFGLLGHLLKPSAFEPDMTKFTEENIKHRLQGIISYYPGNSEMIPKLIHHEPIKILMSPEQDAEYWKIYRKEVALANGPPEILKDLKPDLYKLMKRLQPMAKLRVMSRRISNCYYPGNANRRIDTFETEEYDEPKELQKEKNRMLTEDDYKAIELSHNGWLTDEKIANNAFLNVYSPKIMTLLYNIVINNDKKHVVFTFFKQKSGAMLISSLLKHCGITNEIFSGDLNDSKRKNILKRFNSEDNMKGEKVRVLIITEAGSEGISILEAGHLHILESSPRPVKIIQAIGRIARYKSHIRLNEEDRIVHVWRYWSMSSNTPVVVETIGEDGKVKPKTIRNKTAIDEKLFYRAKKIETEVNRFINILKEVSVY